jgi:hypothetical protein
MASSEIHERRRTLRCRNLLVRRAVQMKKKTAVLLMEAGVAYRGRTGIKPPGPGSIFGAAGFNSF